MDARLSSICKGRSKQARGGPFQKCVFFEGGVGSHGCKLGSFKIKREWPKGAPWLEDEALCCLAQEGEGVCVCAKIKMK